MTVDEVKGRPGPDDESIFTYWDGDPESIAEHIAHWRAVFPTYRVVGREEARALMAARYPAALPVFDRIRIPACRSDIARLLALQAYGGLYVDAHCAIVDRYAISENISRLTMNEMIVSTRDAPKFGKILPYNGIVWARRAAPLVGVLLDVAVENLLGKWRRERDYGFEPYHIWALTGPGVLWDTLFDDEAVDGSLKPEIRPRVGSIFETESPIARYVFTSYRGPGVHWSERQMTERLFA